MKRLTTVLVLIISLSLSAISQTILINNKQFILDSVSADQVLSKFELKDKIISELESESLLKDSVFLSIFNDLSLVNDSLQSERKVLISERDAAKKKYKNTVKISILSAIVVFFIGSLF